MSKEKQSMNEKMIEYDRQTLKNVFNDKVCGYERVSTANTILDVIIENRGYLMKRFSVPDARARIDDILFYVSGIDDIPFSETLARCFGSIVFYGKKNLEIKNITRSDFFKKVETFGAFGAIIDLKNQMDRFYEKTFDDMVKGRVKRGVDIIHAVEKAKTYQNFERQPLSIPNDTALVCLRVLENFKSQNRPIEILPS